MKLSLIIPVAPGDDSWQTLLQDLAVLDAAQQLADTEVLWVSADAALQEQAQTHLYYPPPAFTAKTNWLAGGNSRAHSMNLGAQAAQGEYLWFVHADSRLDAGHLIALRDSLRQAPAALHYFDLKFYGHKMMWLNAFGVWLRSHLLQTPFGDQALCLNKTGFEAIGAYPEDVAYGEDHLLVWHALQQGIRLRCTGAALLTSARKYEHNGWLRTTGLHVSLWAKQAWPEFMVLLKQRWART